MSPVATVPLHFTGRPLAAARHLLENTPIGDTVTWADSGDRMVVELPAWRLSSGEKYLVDLLRSLSGGGDVNLLAFVDNVDRDCAFALVDVVRLLVGEDES